MDKRVACVVLALLFTGGCKEEPSTRPDGAQLDGPWIFDGPRPDGNGPYPDGPRPDGTQPKDGTPPNQDAPVDVFPGPNPGSGTIYYVATDGKDSNPGTASAPWRTLQHAADTVGAGDMVAIRAGSYSSGFELTSSGAAGNPITFRGESASKVTITGSGGGTDDTIFIDSASHINIEQIAVMNASRAGLRLSYADSVSIRRSRFGDNGVWGIFTDFSNDTLIEDCETYGSKGEHGIYISNSSDRAVIRRNIAHDNVSSGIQINADPLMGGDGVSSDCVIDSNLIYNNGSQGASGINLASVRDSIISNNVIYNNKAGGIAAWDDESGIQYGCRDLTIINNTIYFKPGEGRWCVSVKNGSVNADIRNNILFGGASGGIEFDDDSVTGLSADNNIFLSGKAVAENEDGTSYSSLSQWQGTGRGGASLESTPAAVLVDIAGGDPHLKAGSPAIDKGAAVNLDHDFELQGRPLGGKFDIGADEKQ